MLWPHYGWSMRQALALLLVPDIELKYYLDNWIISVVSLVEVTAL